MISLEYIIFSIVFLAGLYCAVAKGNLIKKIIGLGLMTRATNFLIVSFGFREGGVIPIITSLSQMKQFFALSVDPLPQALVLTSIVIDISVTALALSLAVRIFQQRGTLDTAKMTEVRG